jgi:hypothetical protein
MKFFAFFPAVVGVGTVLGLATIGLGGQDMTNSPFFPALVGATVILGSVGIVFVLHWICGPVPSTGSSLRRPPLPPNWPVGVPVPVRPAGPWLVSAATQAIPHEE